MPRPLLTWLAAPSKPARRPAPRLAVESLEAREVPAAYDWAPTGPGAYNWNDPANWTGGPAGTFPNAPADTATLDGTLSGNQLINLNVGITVGAVTLASAGVGTYTVAANGALGSLTLDSTAGPALLTAAGTGGGDALLANVILADDLTLSGGGSGPLTVSGDFGDTGTSNPVVTLTGTVNLFDGATFGNRVTLAGTGTVTAAPALFTTSFYDGALYASDADTGAFLATLVAPNTASSLVLPAGTDIGPDGNLYIANQGVPSSVGPPAAPSNNSIVRYNLSTFSLSTFVTSAQLQAIADPTASNTASFAPSGLEFGPDGDLYVSQNGGFGGASVGQVIRFDVTGAGGALSYAGTNAVVATGLSFPSGLAFGTAAGDTANLYVANSGAQGVSKVTGATGAAPSTATFVTTGSGGLEFPSGLTFGPDGDLFVADLAAFTKAGKVVRYNPDGSFDSVFVATGTGAGPGDLAQQFPSDVLFDPAGRLLVVNLGPNGPSTSSNDYAGSVRRYTSAGAFDAALVTAAQFPDTGGGGASGVVPSQAERVAAGGVAVSGRLSPGVGTGTGVLTGPATTLGPDTAFAVTINGAGAGAGYDQYAATGPVILGTAALELTVSAAVAPGSTFTILTSTGLTGTFAGLAEGALLTAGGQQFTISYAGNNVTLTRNGTVAPVITAPTNATFLVGLPASFTVTATGSPAPTFAVTAGALPAGLTLDAATGVISGTPTTAGSFPVTVTATNSIGSDTEAFTFTVVTGTAPAFTSASAASLTTTAGGTFQVTVTGNPTPTVAAAGLPAGVTFDPATRVLTVAAGTATGTFALTLTATNGVGTATQNFALTVGAAPVITSGSSLVVAAGAGGSVAVTATGSPTPTLSVTSALPAGVTFNATTGVLTVAPGTPTGTYAIAFGASNSFGSASQAFALTVGTAPLFTSASAATFAAGSGGLFSVTATGSPTPTVAATGLPAGVTFDPATRTLTVAPGLAVGVYPITFTATNALGTATQGFTLTVSPVASGVAPAFTSPAAVAVGVGQALSFQVVATGSPAPAVTVAGTLPAGVGFDPVTRRLVGTPAPGTVGTYLLTLTAQNASGTVTQNFTLTVQASATSPPVFSSATAATFTEGRPGTFTVAATGNPAATLSLTGTLPAGVTFDAASGVLSGTPAAGTAGTYALTFTATSPAGAATQAFTLTVNPSTPALPGRLSVTGPTNGSVLLFEPDAAGRFAPVAGTPTNPFAGLGVIVRSASADVNGDGIADLLLVTGPGTPIRFAVVSGADNSLLVAPTAPFGGSESFDLGGFISAGDVDGDGRAEIVITPDQGGGPRVTVYSLLGGVLAKRADFFGIEDPAFRGGARTALGDIDGDGVPDLAISAGFGGGPRIALFDGTALFGGSQRKLVGDFFAFPGLDATNLRNGVYLALGDVNGDGFADPVFTSGPGGGPRVFVLNGRLIATGASDIYGSPIANFFVAGNDADRGGVRATAVDADGDGLADIAVGSGAGRPANVRVYRGRDLSASTGEPTAFQDLSVFGGGTLADGVYVG